MKQPAKSFCIINTFSTG